MSRDDITGIDGARSVGKQPRIRNTFSVEFPTLSLSTTQPRTANLYQKQYSHDILTVTFSETSTRWFQTIETGVPVQFTWTQDNNKKVWYGYVSHITKNVLSQKRQEMEVRCVGSSFPLKERANRVFTDMTIPEAAKVIAEEFGFNFVGDSNPRRFPQLVIAGHSYWEWLQEQAKRIGFAVVVDGTDMYFREQDSFIDQHITSLPVLSVGDRTPGFGLQFNDRTLDSFHVMKGELLEHVGDIRATKVVGGVDPITMQPFVRSSSPEELGNNLRTNVSASLFTEYRKDQVSNSEKDSAHAAAGSAKMARFTLPAQVKAQGDPRLRPHAPVLVSGTGDLTDGYWIVKEVRHYLQRYGEYTVEMTILTDGTGSNETTSLRQSLPEKANTINLQEALARASNVSSVNGTTTPQLNTRFPMYTESRQGFTRTPATWSTRRGSKA